MYLLFLLMFSTQIVFIAQVDCDRNYYNNRFPPTTTTSTTTEPPDASQPGKIKQTFEGREHSWVPALSAAVIVVIVFLISGFACCIHCPFCLVYRRTENQRVV